MNSVIVGNEFVTPSDLKALTRGQIALMSSDGTFIGAAGDVKKESTYRFVVGIGGERVKYGVWLNPKSANGYREDYKAPEARAISIDNVVVNVSDATVGQEVRLVITTPPFNSFIAERALVTTIVTEIRPNETQNDVLGRLNSLMLNRVLGLNKSYGREVIHAQWLGANFAFSGEPGFNFDVHLEGLIQGDKAINDTAVIIPMGTQAQIKKLEETEDVAAQGYDPNWIQAFSPYGNIFNWDIAESYNSFTIHSRSERTHTFDINSLGMNVTQYIAFDIAGTPGDLVPILNALCVTPITVIP